MRKLKRSTAARMLQSVVTRFRDPVLMRLIEAAQRDPEALQRNALLKDFIDEANQVDWTPYVSGAFDNGPDGAMSLMRVAHDPARGRLAKIFWRAGVDTETLRAVIDFAWTMNHDLTMRAFNMGDLERAFRDSRFPTSHLPERVTAWRGYRGDEDDERGGDGISWTLNREVGAWFAARDLLDDLPRVNVRHMPRLLKMEVSRDDVLAHFTDREEDEIVLSWRAIFHAKARIDGEPNEWIAIARELSARRKRDDKQRLAEMLQ